MDIQVKKIMKYKELTQNISGSLKTLAQDSPDLMKNFNQLSQVAMRDGVIDPKTKELIALAIGVAGTYVMDVSVFMSEP